jgi:hypothetical protein
VPHTIFCFSYGPFTCRIGLTGPQWAHVLYYDATLPRFLWEHSFLRSTPPSLSTPYAIKHYPFPLPAPMLSASALMAYDSPSIPAPSPTTPSAATPPCRGPVCQRRFSSVAYPGGHPSQNDSSKLHLLQCHHHHPLSKVFTSSRSFLFRAIYWCFVTVCGNVVYLAGKKMRVDGREWRIEVSVSVMLPSSDCLHTASIR